MSTHIRQAFVRASRALGPLVLVGALAAALFTVLAPRAVHACSCMVPGTPVEARDAAAAVFAGQVVDIARSATRPEFSSAYPWIRWLSSSADPVRFTFAVSRVWKGRAPSEVQVVSAQSSASCGFEFQSGQDYLVYAVDQNGQFGASLCSRTALLADAGADLATLGPGTVPTATTGTAGVSWYANWLVFTFGGLVLTLTGALIVQQAHRRRDTHS